MLPALEELASDIADLSGMCAELEGTEAAFLIGQMVQHLRQTLERLAERDGMLVGTMPCWAEWQSGVGDDSAR